MGSPSRGVSMRLLSSPERTRGATLRPAASSSPIIDGFTASVTITYPKSARCCRTASDGPPLKMAEGGGPGDARRVCPGAGGRK